MEMRLQITTPPGAAKGFNDKIHMRIIKSFLIGRKSILKKEFINEEGTIIYWVLDCTPAQFIKINRNVGIFSQGVNAFFDNPIASKQLKKRADSPQDYDTMVSMMKEGTKVELIHNADWVQVEQELNKPGWWDRLKDKVGLGT